MSELVLYAASGDVGVITVNNPPVNALSPGVPEGILAMVQKAQAGQALLNRPAAGGQLNAYFAWVAGAGAGSSFF